MRIDKRLKELLTDASRPLKDRVFIALTVVTMGVVFFALLGDILYKEDIVEIVTLVITLFVIPLITFVGVRHNRVEFATRLIMIALVLVDMPVVFFFGGGAQGASVAWLIFTYLYIGLTQSGWWRVTAVAGHTAMVITLFAVGYRHPELIHTHTGGVFYLDAVLGVIEVGLICFAMTWFQNLLFADENRRFREETKRAEELNRSQNRFFSNMSHEIRTPINSILGLNEIILRQPDASDEIRKDAANIQGAGRMLLSLINDILDFSKIEAGRMDIVPVNYNTRSFISEIINMIWLRAQQKGLEFTAEIDPSIPAELYGDEVRVKQILVNLLNNAVKYTKEGSVTLHIEKEEQHDGQVVLVFSVSDTGIDIKQDAIPHLFDAFRREDEEKNAGIEGTGLGLSIVRQLVDLMGGRIVVNSVYMQGSTFNVILKQKVTSPEPIGDIRITGYGSAGYAKEYTAEFTAPDVKLLIVDDNEMNLEVEKKLLLGTGITVDTASGGEEALSKTLMDRYDIILMDHLMPEMDGIECMQRIKNQVGGLNNKVPIIALTANAGSENRDLYARSGFEDYLLKPVSGRQLEEMLILHLPESKVNITEGVDTAKFRLSTARSYSRRIPVVVTTGSVCDLPKSVIRENQIDTIPFIIRSKDNTWYDTIETETGEVIRYMKEGIGFDSDPPSEDDFEAFFSKELKKAHNVIHIALASGICDECARAREAARAYENVRVFDSGLNSGAVGILALIAQRMASRGDTPERITEELEKVRKNIHCSFITDGSYFMRRNDLVGDGIAGFIKTLNIHPFITYRDDRYRIERLSFGDNAKCFGRFIDYTLSGYARPDTDMIMVVYSELSEDERLMIRERIGKHVQFEHVIFQKASSVLAMNIGVGSFGLIFFGKKKGMSYRLGALFEPEERQPSEEFYDEVPVDMPADTQETQILSGSGGNEPAEDKETKWYRRIGGIDGDAALLNSGTEEILRTVLKIFLDTIPEKAEELKALYDAENWKDYTIKVHALKSSARLVGANSLADEAMDLEKAGKAGDIDTIRGGHDEMIGHLLGYQKPLEELFEQEELSADGEI